MDLKGKTQFQHLLWPIILTQDGPLIFSAMKVLVIAEDYQGKGLA